MLFIPFTNIMRLEEFMLRSALALICMRELLSFFERILFKPPNYFSAF